MTERLQALNPPDASVKKRLALVGTTCFLVLYLYGAFVQLENVNHGGNDQSAYMNYSRHLYEDTGYIDGNRMPLFPMIMRLFYEEGLRDVAFFERGKRIGVAISLVCLTGIAFLFFKSFSPLLATNLLLITAFTLFVFKAPYFQPELLFFTLNFVSFVLLCRMFLRPSFRLAALAGLITGLAMMTKGSAFAGLGLFVLFMCLQIGYRQVQRWRAGRQISPRRLLVRLASIALVLLAFAAVLTPYFISSQRIFGRLYYNVNTTFYVWYDSWDEVLTGTRAHGDRVGWPDMPAEALPSMAKYLTEHRPRQIFNRLRNGIETTVQYHCTTYYGYELGYCKYGVLFGAFGLLLGIVTLPTLSPYLKRHVILLLFCGGYFVVYFLLSAWWVPIDPGRRFAQMLFLPVMFALASFLSLRPIREFEMSVFGRRVKVLHMFNLAVFAILLVDVAVTLTWRVGWMYGGD